MARVWRKLTRGGSSRTNPPSDVPPGHVAILVGEACQRFVIRADYLNHPIFHQLLDRAYEEYGHEQDGPLAIPCDVFLFQDIISSLERGTKGSRFSCHFVQKLDWRDSTHFLEDLREDQCVRERSYSSGGKRKISRPFFVSR
ncbi:hypothetical protein CDL15_Pgr002062 [Punica granatum]|uniref:Uncharacterized protein n=1 Tax=Punica granatum TaxID=22663 RepID=A0A218XC27_PUNGR|nr:hypothetical protein CDL15_Pgr002062 [Punica granatum]